MKIKKFYLLPIIIIMLFTLTCCTNPNDNTNTQTKETEGMSYGLVNKQYVGMAKVKVKDEKVVDVIYDEAFLPNTWAVVENKNSDDTQLPNDLIQYTKDEINTYYAKYISIDGVVFEGSIREKDLILDNVTYNTQVINYKNDKIPDLFSYLYNSELNCEWYFNAVKNNKVFICDKDGKKLESYKTLNTYGLLKSEGKYWMSSENSPLGWKGNIDNLIEYLKGKKLSNLDQTKFEKDNTGIEENGYTYQYWTIDGVKTKVTMTDVYQYYKLAYVAYTKAISNER